MIRINLLGVPKPKGKRGMAPAAILPEEVGGGGGGLLLLIIVVVVGFATLAANGFYYLRLKRDGDAIQAKIDQSEVSFQRLAQVKARYQERQKQIEAYKRRVDVIDQLRSNQSGPMTLMTTIGQTVNRTDEVWLDNMTDDGTNIHLTGTALNVHAVADLMHNLQSTGYFKQVDIKSSSQDDKIKDMQTFVFELICQKQATAAPPAKGKPGAAQKPKS